MKILSVILPQKRKQPTFCDATSGFPMKICLRNGCRNSVLMSLHHQSEEQPRSGYLRAISMEFLLARFSDVILWGNQCWRHKWWLFYSGYSRTCCIMIMINSIVLYNDNVSNSYGKSWVSSCEKAWVPLQNHWVPVQGTMRPWVFMYPQLIWRQTQKLCVTCSLRKLKFTSSMIKHNKDSKNYALLNNSHKNSHRNHTNRILYKNIFRSINQSLHPTCYFASLGILMRQGHRMQREQNHCL